MGDTADPVASAHRRRARLATVGGGVASALVVWAVIEYGFDLDITAPASPGGNAQDIGAPNVAVAAAVGGLVGWAMLVLVERFAARPRRVWTTLAVLALVVSMGGPLTGTGITTADRVALIALHLSVAAVIIPLLGRTVRTVRQVEESAPGRASPEL